MPTINKKYIKEKSVPYKRESVKHAYEFYNTNAWKRLREDYLRLNPVCEICKEFGHIEPASDCHHIIPWDRGVNDEEKWKLFLDEKNLMSVCETCHYALHFKGKSHPNSPLNSLTNIEWKYAHRLNMC